MAYVTIEDRVDRLEALFGQFLTEMALINQRAEERNAAAEERNRAAEERMARFETEMREFKDESRAERREMNRRWGDLRLLPRIFRSTIDSGDGQLGDV